MLDIPIAISMVALGGLVLGGFLAYAAVAGVAEWWRRR